MRYLRKDFLLIAILWLPAILFGYCYVITYSVNVPYWDMWDTVVLWVLKFHSSELTLVDFFRIYNDSRLTFPIILSLPILVLSSLNVKVFYVVGFTLYLVGILFLLFLLRKDSKLNYFAFAFLSAPILYYALNPNFLVRYISNLGAFTAPVILLFAFLTVHFLFKAKKSNKYLGSAILTGFASSFSGAPGFSIWFAGLLQLLIQKMDKKWTKIAVWCVSAFLVFFVHFWVLGRPPFYSPNPEYSRHSYDAYLIYIKTALFYPLHKFSCFLCVLGSEVIRDQQTVLLFGILIFSIFVALIAINRKNLELDRFAKWYGLLAFGVLTSLELVVTRSGDIANYFGPPEKIFFLPSYRHYPVVFLPLICVYSLSILYSSLSEENKGKIKTSANAFLKTMLFTLLICSFILNFFPGIKTGENNFVGMSERSAILKTYDVQPDENLKKLFPNSEIVKKRAKKLEELRLSVFAENNILLYKPDEVKLLPQQSQLQGVLRIYNDVKFVLFQHPISNENRSIIVFNEIYIPQNAKLRFSIALHPDVWDPEKGDGVTFEVYIRDEGFEELVFSKYIDPKHNPEERKWNDFEVDLSRYAGRNVTIIFSTLPGPNNDSRWDWAWWGEPRIEW